MRRRLIIKAMIDSGFTNSMGMNISELAGYIKRKYKCSPYLAKQVAEEVIKL